MGQLTYLLLELIWGVPVVLIQWSAGGRVLWRKRKLVVAAVLVPTIYLVGADRIALSEGIWVFHGGRIIGLYIGGVPVEEAIFFLLTNLMIVQTVVLAGLPDSRIGDLSAWVTRRWKGAAGAKRSSG